LISGKAPLFFVCPDVIPAQNDIVEEICIIMDAIVGVSPNSYVIFNSLGAIII